ncbi:GTP cyclohydrolase II [Nanchangia anserum]|uniref:GTP cyclohydrolase-2 n=2 Tax=Nanchangia anserum TaxID=2692125 RepID=A0A8I0GBR0_9ACTO|nr:GTP cyclohydrolase II [Nanchangia anserum]MBD3689096.1 GTP cyclohydrolase II [Nanchangia anserum]QOX82628.1 GTP cyclohydrolase II [Nanchangia anserum]
MDAVIADLRAGKPVLVADSRERENEVDAIMAAETASTRWVAWMVRHTSGYLCAPMPLERADALKLPEMVPDTEDPKHTCYTISCDAARGVTTGISAGDRARTLRVLADPHSAPGDLIRPGHILPLRARPGGVRERGGHTEATVDLLRLAGMEPVGVIGELVHDDGDMVRYDDAQDMARKCGLYLLTVKELRSWLEAEDAGEAQPSATPAPSKDGERVALIATAKLPTRHGDFIIHSFRDLRTGAEHIALTPDTPSAPAEVALARIHSECLTGEAFGSLRCDCGPQLDAALEQIAVEGGALVYLRGHEGRGIGLGEKIRAYHLQDSGLDTAQANLELGWAVDLREYGAGAAILAHLGITRVRLLTNNPDKVRLDPSLVDVVEAVPLEVGLDPHNIDYLRTKAALGHTFHHLDACETH